MESIDEKTESLLKGILIVYNQNNNTNYSVEQIKLNYFKHIISSICFSCEKANDRLCYETSDIKNHDSLLKCAFVSSLRDTINELEKEFIVIINNDSITKLMKKYYLSIHNYISSFFVTKTMEIFFKTSTYKDFYKRFEEFIKTIKK